MMERSRWKYNVHVYNMQFNNIYNSTCSAEFNCWGYWFKMIVSCISASLWYAWKIKKLYGAVETHRDVLLLRMSHVTRETGDKVLILTNLWREIIIFFSCLTFVHCVYKFYFWLCSLLFLSSSSHLLFFSHSLYTGMEDIVRSVSVLLWEGAHQGSDIINILMWQQPAA